MATLHLTTVSKSALIKPEYRPFLEDYLDRCYFIGGFGDLTAKVATHENGEDPYLWIGGGGVEFQPIVPADVPDDCPPVSAEKADPEQFLETIAPALKENFVVQVVGHEKTRFPVVAYQYRVSPDGTVLRDSFSWNDGALDPDPQTTTSSATEQTESDD